MKRYQRFQVTGTEAGIKQVLSSLQRLQGKAWHQVITEANETDTSDLLCFECEPSIGIPQSKLYIALKDQGCVLYDANIVPVHVNKLSLEECNSVIQSFVTEILEPIVEGTGLHLDILNEQFEIGDYMSEPVHKLLRKFSDVASKDGAALHSLDRDRWIRFIIASHRERADWVASQMEKWLVSEGWSHDAAERLAAEYEFARALLDANEPRGPV